MNTTMEKHRALQSAFVLVLLTLLSGCSAKKNIKTPESVRIEKMEWMSRNLDSDIFRNGDMIPEAKTDEEWYKAGKEGKPAWCYYENNVENGSKYGKLYNFFAVTDSRGLAPAGWHVSSDAEWRQVTDFLDGEDAAGTMMKSRSGWTGEGNGTNVCGFAGLPGGCRDLNGRFSAIDSIAFWWSSTEKDSLLAWYRCIDNSPYYVYRTNYYKQNGLSVRCIMD
jgi:uncharacterized protein (TIGR02145 family)